MRLALLVLTTVCSVLAGCSEAGSGRRCTLAQRQFDHDTQVFLFEIRRSLSGEQAHIIALDLSKNGELTRIASAPVVGDEGTFSLNVDRQNQRAWVVNKRTNHAVLSADLGSGKSWDNPQAQPSWAKP